jgi:hypothetical protein
MLVFEVTHLFGSPDEIDFQVHVTLEQVFDYL